MSGSVAPEEKKTLMGIGIALLIAFTATPVLVYLVVQYVMNDPTRHGDRSAITPEVIAANIKPVGRLVMEGTPEAAAPAAPAAAAAAAKAPRSGEEIVKNVCSACHATGALNAPKIGDKAAWAAHIEEGVETLVKNAINGIRQMPPRGGAADLSDQEMARAVVYMANQSGASFKEPKAGEAVAAAAPAPMPAAEAAEAAKPGEAPAGESRGEKIYESTCAACHATGAAGAPKLGDKAAWGPRIATGNDALYASALKGKGVMPPKGGNAGLPDDDIKAAVDYMVAQSK